MNKQTSKFIQKRVMRKEEQEFDQKVLDVARVARMQAGGRRFRFRTIVAVGDGKGRVGLGLGKGADIMQAIEKAGRKAKKNLIKITLDKHTLPFAVETKYKSARVLLKPAAEGRGVIAGGSVRILCELAGIKNVSAKILSRTTNKLNVARATLKAFKMFDVVKHLQKEEKKEETRAKQSSSAKSVKGRKTKKES